MLDWTNYAIAVGSETLNRGGDTDDLQEEEAQDHGTIVLNYEINDVV